MKKLLIILVLLFSFAIADKNPQKFKVDFVITYSAITLEEAAKIEKELLEKYGEYCIIKIRLNQERDIADFKDAPTYDNIDSLYTLPDLR